MGSSSTHWFGCAEVHPKCRVRELEDTLQRIDQMMQSGPLNEARAARVRIVVREELDRYRPADT